jgi:hypothetical protein
VRDRYRSHHINSAWASGQHAILTDTHIPWSKNYCSQCELSRRMKGYYEGGGGGWRNREKTKMHYMQSNIPETVSWTSLLPYHSQVSRFSIYDFSSIYWDTLCLYDQISSVRFLVFLLPLKNGLCVLKLTIIPWRMSWSVHQWRSVRLVSVPRRWP